MAKLKEFKLPIAPEIITGKLKVAQEKFKKAFSGVVDPFASAAKKAGSFAVGMNNAMQLAQQIKAILTKGLEIAKKLVAQNDETSDIAAMGGVTAGQVESLITGMASASSPENTKKMFKMFLQKAISEDREVSGVNSRGEKYNAIDTFVSVFKELNKLQGATNEEDLKRSRGIYNTYFSGRQAKDAQDLIAAVVNFDRDKIRSGAEQGIQTASINAQEKAASKMGQDTQITRLYMNKMMWDKNLIDMVVKENREQLKTDLEDLDRITPESVMATTQIFKNIEKAIQDCLGVLTNFAPLINQIVGYVSEIVETITKVADKVLGFFNREKTPEQIRQEDYLFNVKRSNKDLARARREKDEDKRQRGIKRATARYQIAQSEYEGKEFILHNDKREEFQKKGSKVKFEIRLKG